jgi:4-amino-4-deoxy-L-arabinose transferase-like glycosyltransferase
MKRANIDLILVALMLVSSVLVRAWGIAYDLPYIYHPDEPGYIGIIQRIFKSGDLNPRFFNYPSLFFYINALAYVPYYLFGKLVGVFQAPGDILAPVSLVLGTTKTQMPTTVLLGRIVTACFGVGTVGLAYLSGKRLSGRRSMGVLASLMVAISPTNVWNSRFVTPDTFVAFFALASLLTSILIYEQGKTWQYVIGGICVGLTASSKYNGGLVILTLMAAHFLRHGRTSFKQPRLYAALLLCLVAFLATTPFAILDFAEFMDDLRFEAQHYAAGHAGMEGESLKWYLNYMWSSGGGLYLLATLGIIHNLLERPKETALVSIFPLVYFGFISSFAVRNDRTLLPLTPFLFLSAAWLLVDIFDRARSWRRKSLRRVSMGASIVLLIVILAFPISKTVQQTRHLTRVDSRETARVWINENLPSGAKVAIEPYSPFIDPARFSVHGMQIAEQNPDWYFEQGFDYLVFAEGMYGRFYREPERYQAQILRYERLFERFELVAMFTDGDYEVRIYSVE